MLPAEAAGMAKLSDDLLDIGGLKLPVPVHHDAVPVYVRRRASDLSILEIEIAFHDGPEQEELHAKEAEADRYPLGRKEYWRSAMVGKYTYGADNHPMTEEEFVKEWAEA
ncbi:MAG TPA: hypothetical protein VK988_03565 [Acidimicrobiales bacterium]|nr:hypothetical protein [Acidimicrobiales bacterium]